MRNPKLKYQSSNFGKDSAIICSKRVQSRKKEKTIQSNNICKFSYHKQFDRSYKISMKRVFNGRIIKH